MKTWECAETLRPATAVSDSVFPEDEPTTP